MMWKIEKNKYKIKLIVFIIFRIYYYYKKIKFEQIKDKEVEILKK